MKQNIWIKITAGLALLLVFILPVHANSALTFWRGTEGNGAVTGDADCPVEVEHETLTFVLHDQPVPDLKIDQNSSPYTNRFEAEYTFHNPSDMKVKALLSFPFGKAPYYISEGSFDDLSLYQVQINGKETDAKVRYSMKLEDTPFSLKEDLPLLSDVYISDSFFTLKLPVKEYRIRFHLDTDKVLENQAVIAKTAFTRMPKEQKILIEPELNSIQYEENSVVIGQGTHDGDEIAVYVFGTDLDSPPEWVFSVNTGTENYEIEGSAELIAQNEMTYEEFIMGHEKEPADISDLDYYNVMTSILVKDFADGTVMQWNHRAQNGMMKWLQYELEFEPGETLVNTVTAPAWPDIYTNYDPPLYSYYYLLSPASSWKKFGTLDIVIETDQYLQRSSPGTFEKTEGGYQAHFERLPEEELTFDICASEDPKRDINYGYWIFALLVIVLPLTGIILFIVLVITVIRLLMKRRKDQ